MILLSCSNIYRPKFNSVLKVSDILIVISYRKNVVRCGCRNSALPRATFINVKVGVASHIQGKVNARITSVGCRIGVETRHKISGCAGWAKRAVRTTNIAIRSVGLAIPATATGWPRDAVPSYEDTRASSDEFDVGRSVVRRLGRTRDRRKVRVCRRGGLPSYSSGCAKRGDRQSVGHPIVVVFIR